MRWCNDSPTPTLMILLSPQSDHGAFTRNDVAAEMEISGRFTYAWAAAASFAEGHATYR